jgi:hypothetical protein
MYKLLKSQTLGIVNAVRKEENGIVHCIPFDPDNTDYQAYLRWLEAGNTPTSADEPNNG